MSIPTTRLLALLELLQSRRRASGPELASRLGIDGRTLRRYIVKLEKLGVPVTAERGRGGAYMLVAGFKLPPLMFTDDEALAMSIGLLTAEAMEIHQNQPAVASARAKLERVMPARLRRRMRAVNESIRFDPTMPSRSSSARTDAAVLKSLTSAAQEQQRVKIKYRAPSGIESSREIDPYGLAFRNGVWYAIGYCHLRRDLRSFRLDRIQYALALATQFQKAAGFDILKYLERSIAMLPRAIAVEVLLQADLKTAQADFTPVIGTFEPASGGTLLRSRTDDLAWFARQLARVSFPFRINFPIELYREVNAIGARLAAM